MELSVVTGMDVVWRGAGHVHRTSMTSVIVTCATATQLPSQPPWSFGPMVSSKYTKQRMPSMGVQG